MAAYYMVGKAYKTIVLMKVIDFTLPWLLIIHVYVVGKAIVLMKVIDATIRSVLPHPLTLHVYLAFLKSCLTL